MVMIIRKGTSLTLLLFPLPELFPHSSHISSICSGGRNTGLFLNWLLGAAECDVLLFNLSSWPEDLPCHSPGLSRTGPEEAASWAEHFGAFLPGNWVIY